MTAGNVQMIYVQPDLLVNYRGKHGVIRKPSILSFASQLAYVMLLLHKSTLLYLSICFLF